MQHNYISTKISWLCFPRIVEHVVIVFSFCANKRAIECPSSASTRVKLAPLSHPLTGHRIMSFIGSDLSQIHRELRVSIGFSMSANSVHPTASPNPRKQRQLPNFRTARRAHSLCTADYLWSTRNWTFLTLGYIQTGQLFPMLINAQDSSPLNTSLNSPTKRLDEVSLLYNFRPRKTQQLPTNLNEFPVKLLHVWIHIIFLPSLPIPPLSPSLSSYKEKRDKNEKSTFRFHWHEIKTECFSYFNARVLIPCFVLSEATIVSVTSVLRR